MKRYDVCIIGGGAAGLAAAASLENHIAACVLEKNQILGRKIMATGGGRCNITNEACPHKEITLEFFNGMGLELYHDSEGRYYPYSNQASDVVHCLQQELKSKNCQIKTGFLTQKVVSTENEGFLVEGVFSDQTRKTERIFAEHLILATGGKAAPQMGTTGDGYGFAREMGHTITRVYPILTGIECGDFEAIKGIRARGTVKLICHGRALAAEQGEIQFTKDGISGICVFNLTPHIQAKPGETIQEALQHYRLELDLAPDFTREQLEGRKSSFGILSKKLAAVVSLAEIKRWQLPILGIKGWKHAQCTAGGICLDEIDAATMESRLVKRLYLVGELLDVQGPCGGYNLQNAWETGIRAAQAVNQACGNLKK